MEVRHGRGCAKAWPFLCADKPTAGTDKHPAERIMQQLEEDGDFTAEGVQAVRQLVGYSA